MALKQAFSTTDGVTDLLYVATNLNLHSNDVPSVFTITYTVDKPLEVFSPAFVYGPTSMYEFNGFFQFYDPITETWTDGDAGVVSAEIKANVLLQQEAYDIYLSQLGQWQLGYDSSRLAYYKKYMAQALIDACAP